MANQPTLAPPLVDAPAVVPSLRTLGTGSQQAAPGDDARFPSGGSAGHVAYWTSSTIVASAGELFWNNADNWLGINMSTNSTGYTLALGVTGGYIWNDWGVVVIDGGSVDAQSHQVLDSSNNASGLWGVTTSNQMYWSSAVTDTSGKGAFLFQSNSVLSNADLAQFQNGAGNTKASISNSGTIYGTFLSASGTPVADGTNFKVTLAAVDTNTAYSSSPNTGIQFGGKRDGSGNLSGMAGIGFTKANVSTDDAGGVLQFFTRPTGDHTTTSQTERGRVLATGHWLFGTVSDDASGAIVQVAGKIKSTTGGIVYPDGTTQTTAFTGATGVDTLAAVGSSPNANAGSISSTTLTLQPASVSFPGVVTTGTQTFAGVKTFSSGITSNVTGNVTGNTSGSAGTFTGSLSGDVTGTQSATVLSNIPATATMTSTTGTVLTSSVDASVTHTILKIASSGALTGNTKFLSLFNNTNEKFYFDDSGNQWMAGAISIAESTGNIAAYLTEGAYVSLDGSTHSLKQDATSHGIELLSAVADSGTNSAFILNTSNTLTTGRDYLVIKNNGTAKWTLGIAGVTYPDGTTQTTAFTGSGAGGVNALAAVGSSPNANAGSIAGTTLTLQPASASFPGVLSAAHYSLLAGATALSTGSTLVERDSSGNAQFINAVQGYTTTATAAATTTLTVASTYEQRFTGSTTQNVVLPDATTLVTGISYFIVNKSSGTVTVKDNSSSTVVSVLGGQFVLVTCTNIGSAAGAWDFAGMMTMTSTGNMTVAGTLSASNLSNTNSGDITLAAVGSSPAAEGAALSSQVLTLQPADATHPGLVTTGTQSFAGAKTFTGAISASNLSNTNSGDVTLAAVGSSPNGNGASLSTQVLTLQPADGSNPGLLSAAHYTLLNAATSNATASTLMKRDASANVRINNIIQGFTTTATAAGTTTLAVGDTYTQIFTGSTTQTVVLPDATTLVVGHQFRIVNRSSGTVTVNKNGGSLSLALTAGADVLFTVTAIGTSAGTWDAALITVAGTLSGLTSGLIPYATAATTIANSGIQWDNSNTRLGINQTSSLTRTLEVWGAPTTESTNAKVQLTIIDNTTGFSSSPASGISFGGRTTGVPDYNLWSAIDARKANANSGDAGGNLRFYVRATGASSGTSLAEVGRFTETSHLLIGTTTDTSNFLYTMLANSTAKTYFATGFNTNTPSVTIDNPSGKCGGFNAGTGGSGFFYDNSGTFGFATETAANIRAGTAGNGTTVAGLDGSGNFFAGGTSASSNKFHVSTTRVSINTNGQGSQGNLWVSGSSAGALGGDLWIVNAASNTLSSSCRIVFGADGTTDNTPNAGFTNVITNVGTFLSDVFLSIYDGSAFNEKFRWVGGTNGDAYFKNEAAKLGLNGSGLTSYIAGDSSTHGMVIASNTTDAAGASYLRVIGTNTAAAMDIMSFCSVTTQKSVIDRLGYHSLSTPHTVTGKRTGTYTIATTADVSFTSMNLPAPLTQGTWTAAPAQDSTMMMLKAATGSSNGNVAGIGGPYTVTRFDYRPRCSFVVRTDAAVTNQRIYIGLSAADLSGFTTLAATNATRHVCFRYDTTIGDTNWMAVTSDGTTASATSTAIAVTANTTYTLEIDFMTAGTVQFRINNNQTAQVRKVSNPPTGTTDVGIQASLTTLTGSAQNLYISKMVVEHN